MIKVFSFEDLNKCCELYLQVFNAPPWNDKWTEETAHRCLSDLVERKRFLGYTFWENDILVGAVFSHTKTFYTGDEIYIDELFISPDCQRKGYGMELMYAIEKYAKENSITCITLLTDIHKPAFEFYEKHDFSYVDRMVFMYKRLNC